MIASSLLSGKLQSGLNLAFAKNIMAVFCRNCQYEKVKGGNMKLVLLIVGGLVSCFLVGTYLGTKATLGYVVGVGVGIIVSALFAVEI